MKKVLFGLVILMTMGISDAAAYDITQVGEWIVNETRPNMAPPSCSMMRRNPVDMFIIDYEPSTNNLFLFFKSRMINFPETAIGSTTKAQVVIGDDRLNGFITYKGRGLFAIPFAIQPELREILSLATELLIRTRQNGVMITVKSESLPEAYVAMMECAAAMQPEAEDHIPTPLPDFNLNPNPDFSPGPAPDFNPSPAPGFNPFFDDSESFDPDSINIHFSLDAIDISDRSFADEAFTDNDLNSLSFPPLTERIRSYISFIMEELGYLEQIDGTTGIDYAIEDGIEMQVRSMGMFDGVGNLSDVVEVINNTPTGTGCKLAASGIYLDTPTRGIVQAAYECNRADLIFVKFGSAVIREGPRHSVLYQFIIRSDRIEEGMNFVRKFRAAIR